MFITKTVTPTRTCELNKKTFEMIIISPNAILLILAEKVSQNQKLKNSLLVCCSNPWRCISESERVNFSFFFFVYRILRRREKILENEEEEGTVRMKIDLTVRKREGLNQFI